jgi:two-component system sensor histidine kinase RegB
MADQSAEEAHRTGRSVRLDTLVRLRWFAVIGQTTAVLVVYFGLDYGCRSGPASRSSRFPPGSMSRCAFGSA